MKNIVIALNNGSSFQRNSITNYLTSNKWAFWHWIDDLWIVQTPNSMSPTLMYGKIESGFGMKKATMLLFEVNENFKFGGRLPSDAWDWLGMIGKIG